MSKKAIWFVAITFLLSLAALGVGVMAWLQAWMNQPIAAPVLGDTVEITDVAGVTAAKGDLALDLVSRDEGGNTQVTWHCGKTLMGSRHDYTGAWTHVVGRLLLAPASRTLRAGELHVSVDSMRGHGAHPAPNGLINTVRENRWFLVSEHPTAVFRCRSLTPRREGEEAKFDRAVADWTHTIDGTLKLNGIERELSVFARAEVTEDSVRLDATFPISRTEYGIAKRTGFEPPANVDDQVVVEVHIHATPDPMSVAAELNRQVVSQQAAIGRLQDQTKKLGAHVDRLVSTVDELRRDFAQIGKAKTTVDLASLSPRFEDRVDYSNPGKDERFLDLGFTADFAMVLVPGDPSKQIGPFYVQTTEVTWKMFRAWSYCEDVSDEAYAAKLREADLRPSPCYDDASRGHGFEDRAALGVSRRNAQAFCRHLSERTGRHYRLMTDAEWHYLAEAGGGVPAKPHDSAWLAGNADTDDFDEPISMPVGRKPANKLGLHDFWGNVAEWVMGDTEYIRGGSFLVKAEDLALGWQENEDQDVWNATYPNIPRSRWWYRDRFDMGFRLVCDPVNIPKGK